MSDLLNQVPTGPSHGYGGRPTEREGRQPQRMQRRSGPTTPATVAPPLPRGVADQSRAAFFVINDTISSYIIIVNKHLAVACTIFIFLTLRNYTSTRLYKG